MADLALVANYRNKKCPGATLIMSGAEDAVTVSTNNPISGTPGTATQTRFGGSMPTDRATIQMVCATAWTYHSLVGQVATDGYPVAANQAITLTFQDGDVFYVLGTAAAVLHAVVVGY